MRYIHVDKLRAGSSPGQARHSCQLDFLGESGAVLAVQGIAGRALQHDAAVLRGQSFESVGIAAHQGVDLNPASMASG